MFLLDRLITSKDITEAENKSQKRRIFRRRLSHGGKISEDDLRRLEAYILGIPCGGGKKKIDFAVLSLIPEPIARNHNIVAYRRNKDDLRWAMLDPEDLGKIDFIKRKPV